MSWFQVDHPVSILISDFQYRSVLNLVSDKQRQLHDIPIRVEYDFLSQIKIVQNGLEVLICGSLIHRGFGHSGLQRAKSTGFERQNTAGKSSITL